MGDLSENFSRVEFACRCGCGFDGVDPLLVDMLERARAIYGRPIVIISGCRCPSHNEKSKGSVASQHMGLRWDSEGKELEPECAAVDIAIAGTGQRHALVGALFNAGATGIGPSKGFVHGDVGVKRPGVVRPALWGY